MRVLGNKVGKGVAVHSKTYFFGIGNFSIGNHSCINMGCFIDNRGKITIGDNVNISHNTKIYTAGHNVDDPSCSLTVSYVVIEDDAWIFPNCLIMPGVTVGRGAVIYPGSVVIRDVLPYSIVGGNPAKHIRYRNNKIDYVLNNKVWFSI